MKSIFLFSMFSFMYFQIQAQDSTIQWQKIFGDPGGVCFLKSAIPTLDSGYIIGGYGNGSGIPFGGYGGYDIFAQKYDKFGNPIWSKICYGGHKNDTLGEIIPTVDKGAIIVGSTSSANNGKSDYDVSYNHGNYDVWIVKVDSNGKIEWDKSYGSSKNDYGSSICSTYDGGYVIAGYSDGSDSNLTKNK